MLPIIFPCVEELKKKKIVTLIIVAIVFMLSAYYYFNTKAGGSNDDHDQLVFRQQLNTEGWLLTVYYVHVVWGDYEHGWEYDNLECTNPNGTTSMPFNEIVEKYDDSGTIIYHDNDNNNLLSLNDTFEIRRDTHLFESGSYFTIRTLATGLSYGVRLV